MRLDADFPYAIDYPTETPALTFGWGVQNDANHAQPVTQLRGLNVHTTKCSDIPELPIEYTAYWEPGVPVFFCVRPTATGALCTGDEGGAGPALLLLHS